MYTPRARGPPGGPPRPRLPPGGAPQTPGVYPQGFCLPLPHGRVCFGSANPWAAGTAGKPRRVLTDTDASCDGSPRPPILVRRRRDLPRPAIPVALGSRCVGGLMAAARGYSPRGVPSCSTPTVFPPLSTLREGSPDRPSGGLSLTAMTASSSGLWLSKPGSRGGIPGPLRGVHGPPRGPPEPPLPPAAGPPGAPSGP